MDPAHDATEFAFIMLGHNGYGITTVELVTPETARAYLAHNKRNRPLRLNHVRVLADSIRRGDWQVTHQGIAFNHDGTLLDGQHRLAAIVEADTPAILRVTRGLSVDSMYGIDQGVVRNITDIAFCTENEWGITRNDAAIARAMLGSISQTSGKGFNGQARTHKQLIEFMAKHREAIEFAAARFLSAATKSSVIQGVIARAYYSVDEDRLIHFCNVMESGVATDEGDRAAVVLARYYLANKRLHLGAAGRSDLYRKAESALSAFVRRQPITKLYGSSEELYPLPGE